MSTNTRKRYGPKRHELRRLHKQSRAGVAHLAITDETEQTATVVFGERAYDIPLEVTQRIKELRAALFDMIAQNRGQPKSCGHDFICSCPKLNAIAALKNSGGIRQ